MGVAALWQLLRAEEVVEWYRGGITEEHAALVAAVDGQAVAIDLSTWIMQADQQTALTPHFSREERCMKVAFERALQWLRHGCLPVAVVEGQPPAEKLAAQRARFEARNGYAGGGSQAGAAHFQRLGQAVGRLLEELGLPVFYAPGEAEAVCAALNRAGSVDAAASSDSDTLLYGAETLLQTLKLSTTQKEECELKRVCMASIRRRLGVQRGGAKALCVLAALSGSDYDLDGAQGVGSAGGLAVARFLLQGDDDDSQVLERLAALVQRPPQRELLELTQCTGCQSCGHEGGRKARIKRHSSRNRCTCCPPAEDGACQLVSFARCSCAFHRLETERRVERILERVRGSPGFLQEAQAAIAVFERQGRDADAYVRGRLEELGCQQGQRLHWLHRPRVQGVFDIIDAKRRQMLWDLAAVRSKLLPVMLEWDMQQQAAAAEQGGMPGEAEFRAVAIQKVHGLKSKGDRPTEAHWRYVLSWERLEADVEQLGTLEVRPKKPRAGSKAAAAAAAAAAEHGEKHGSFLGSQAPSQALSQLGSFSPGGSQVEHLAVRQFDLRWMKEQPAEHRALRITAVHRLLPQLEAAWRQQLEGTSKGGKGGAGAARKAGRAGGKKGARPGSAGGGATREGPASAALAQGSRAGGRVLRQLLLDEGSDEEEAGGAGADRAAVRQQRQQQRPQAPDITRYLAQRRPGSTAAPAAAGKAAAGGQAARGYGLAASGAGAEAAPRQQEQPSYQLHLPASAASMQALLSRALGAGSSQEQQEGEQRRQQHRPPPDQRGSPFKKLCSPRGHTGADVSGPSPGSRSAAADSDFEVLLTSPESPAERTQPQREQPGQACRALGGAARGGADSDEDLVPLALALDMAGMAPPEGHGPGSMQDDGDRGQQQRAPPASQQQRQQQVEPKRPTQQPGWRSSPGGATGANIAAGPASSPARPMAAAAEAAGADAAAAAAHQGRSDEDDFVNLVTPPRPAGPRLPAAGQAAGSRVAAPARHHGAGGSKQQAAPAPLPSSPIDLTLSDDDCSACRAP